jgi:hypothetical protein
MLKRENECKYLEEEKKTKMERLRNIKGEW